MLSAISAAIRRTSVSRPLNAMSTHNLTRSTGRADGALLGHEQERDLVWLGGELALAVAPLEQQGEVVELRLGGNVGERHAIQCRRLRTAVWTRRVVDGVGRSRDDRLEPLNCRYTAGSIRRDRAGSPSRPAIAGWSSTADPRRTASGRVSRAGRMQWWCVSTHSAPLSRYWPSTNGRERCGLVRE
jgi:hypothetical protein